MEISFRVQRSILKWFGHIERMNAIYLTKRVRNVYVDGRAPTVRPRFRWMDG